MSSVVRGVAKKVQIYYDVLSPFSWIAFEVKGKTNKQCHAWICDWIIKAESYITTDPQSLSIQVEHRLGVLPILSEWNYAGSRWLMISNVVDIKISHWAYSHLVYTGYNFFSHSDNRPPGMVPAKARYMETDVRRLSQYFQIPLKSPTVISESPSITLTFNSLHLQNPAEVMFVKGSLKAQRLLIAAKMTIPEHLEELSRQLWLRIWSRVG